MNRKIGQFVIRMGVVFLGIPLLLGQCGCLVGADTTRTQSGRYVSENTFDQVEPGKTTTAWLQATLGDPSEKKKLDDGSEIWKWTYTEEKKSDGYVFLIFAGHDKKVTTCNAFVELKEGVVTSKWRG